MIFQETDIVICFQSSAHILDEERIQIAKILSQKLKETLTDNQLPTDILGGRVIAKDVCEIAF
jgi:hypothetical protein